MDKAYDVSDLVVRLKGKGLDIAEEGAKLATVEVFAWLEDSAKLSATPYDNLGLVILPLIKDLALQAADKIDGQVG